MTRVSFSFFSFIFVILIFGSTSAYGQLQDVSDRRVQVYVGGSPTYPYSTSEFGDFYQTGYTFTGGVGITLTPEWELSFHGAYSQFDLDEGAYRSSVAGSSGSGFEGEMAVYTGAMSLKYLIYVEGRWVPYFVAGGGVYRKEEENIDVIIAGQSFTSAFRTNQTLAGIHVGAGLAVRTIDAMSLFIEPRYTATASFQNTDESTVDYIEVRMGLIVAPF